MFTSEKHIRLQEVDSTNSYLKALAEKENLPEGTAVSAAYQSRGRGQRGTSWESKAGENIMVSVLYYPVFLSLQKQFVLSQAVALAVHDFVALVTDKKKIVKIKWPNDIYLENKKVAGILIENNLQGNKIRNSIIGIGININQQQGLVEGATSLAREMGKSYNPDELFPLLFSRLEYQYQQIAAGNYHSAEEQYLHELYGRDELKIFINNNTGESFSGIIRGVSPDGRLRVEAGNFLHEFDLKEIKLKTA